MDVASRERERVIATGPVARIDQTRASARHWRSGAGRRSSSMRPDPGNLPLFHPDNLIGNVEIALVMSDRNNSASLRLQLWQQDFVIVLAKFWILLGGPFVEDANGPVFQAGHNHGEAFALSRGEISGAEAAIAKGHLVLKLHLGKQATKRHGVNRINAIQPVKEMEI